MRQDLIDNEIERICNELGLYEDEGTEGSIIDIQNGYNGSFHDYEGKVHTYQEIRIKAENNISEDED